MPQGGGSQALASRACREAAHDICRAADACFASGLPPTTGHSPTFDSALCVGGEVTSVAYTTLRELEPDCAALDENGGQACVTAIARYCAARGAVSGFGPVGGDAVTIDVTCLTDATIVTTTTGALQELASRCVPDPITCQGASRGFCEGMGFVGGFGPIAWREDDVVDVVCVGSR